ncbi:MAG: hypothetical protein QM520_03430, partial [Gammaproteobacteria bacterium]|nr:hypothetical protein [Gammaproteobacteria bacterium]
MALPNNDNLYLVCDQTWMVWHRWQNGQPREILCTKAWIHVEDPLNLSVEACQQVREVWRKLVSDQAVRRRKLIYSLPQEALSWDSFKVDPNTKANDLHFLVDIHISHWLENYQSDWIWAYQVVKAENDLNVICVALKKSAGKQAVKALNIQGTAIAWATPLPAQFGGDGQSWLVLQPRRWWRDKLSTASISKLMVLCVLGMLLVFIGFDPTGYFSVSETVNTPPTPVDSIPATKATENCHWGSILETLTVIHALQRPMQILKFNWTKAGWSWLGLVKDFPLTLENIPHSIIEHSSVEEVQENNTLDSLWRWKWTLTGKTPPHRSDDWVPSLMGNEVAKSPQTLQENLALWLQQSTQSGLVVSSFANKYAAGGNSWDLVWRAPSTHWYGFFEDFARNHHQLLVDAISVEIQGTQTLVSLKMQSQKSQLGAPIVTDCWLPKVQASVFFHTPQFTERASQPIGRLAGSEEKTSRQELDSWQGLGYLAYDHEKIILVTWNGENHALRLGESLG